MLQTRKVVILGTLAASAMLVGAMQLASGHDLATVLPAQASIQSELSPAANDVNRASKADRAVSTADAMPTQTVSIKLAAFTDTSFLLRLPLTNTGLRDQQGARGASPQGSKIITTQTERREARWPVACEPSVSVLTEVAKRLQPGRCVT